MPQIVENTKNNQKQKNWILIMDSLNYAQLNTQHCKAAMAHLSLILSDNKIDILLNQEPYCYNDVPSLCPLNYIPFYDNTHKPRACIFIKKDIAHNFMLLHTHSTPDNVIVVTSTNPPSMWPVPISLPTTP